MTNFWRLIFFSVLTLPFFSTALYSADDMTVRGRIVDADAKRPIKHAVIISEATKHSVQCNDSGYFSLRLPVGTWHIHIKAMGYRVEHRDVSPADEHRSIEIFLTSLPIETPTVVVSGNASNASAHSADIGHSHIMRGLELQQELGQTLAMTLKNETGMAVRSMGPAPARPVIRGLSGVRIAINEDNAPSSDLSATSPDHSVAIDPILLEEIEIIRGPKALLFSQSSLGGVINSIRNDIPSTLPHYPAIAASGGYESVNRGLSGAATIEIPVDILGVKGSYSTKSTDNIQTPTGRLTNTGIFSEHIGLGAGIPVEEVGGGLAATQFRSEYGIPGGFIGGHPNGVKISMEKRLATFRGIWRPQNSYVDDMQLTVSRTYYKHTERESNGKVGADFRVINYNALFLLKHHENTAFMNGTSGMSMNFRDYEVGGFVFMPATTSQDVAFFSFQEWQWGKTSFQGSARLNLSHVLPSQERETSIGLIRPRNFASLSATISALYTPEAGYSFGGIVSRSSRPPSIEELFSLGPHLAAYSFETGNPNLNNEVGYGVEVFFSRSADNLQWNATMFYTYFPQFLTPRNSGEINYATFLPIFRTSAVNAALYGAESKLILTASSILSWENTLSSTFGDNLDEHRPMPMIPPIKLLSELRFGNEEWSIKGRVELAAAQRRTDLFEEATAGYAVVGLSAHRTIVVGTSVCVIALTADNVGNSVWRNHLSRIKSVFPEPGTNIRILLRFWY